MGKYLSVLLILCLVPFDLLSQLTDPFPVVDKNDLPDAMFSPARSFTGESLYGYIDGGADLYLEYGFEGVVVTEFTYQRRKYKTEIFRMSSPEAAFGIFSVSRFRCKSRPPLTDYTCQNKYQLQLCCGQYYINIVNESGTGADSAASVRIGKIIIEKAGVPSVDLDPFFPGILPETIKNEAVLVKGRLGIINGASDLEGYLKGLRECTAIILKAPGKTLVSINFYDIEGMRKFGVSHSWDMNKLSAEAFKMASGETVRKLYSHHVLIEIPDSPMP